MSIVYRVSISIAFLVGCGDNLDPSSPSAMALPGCADLGCPNVIAGQRHCAATGECSCRPDRSIPAQACAPSCADLNCASISCGDLTPDGDEDPVACTCELDVGYVSCRAE